MSEGATEARSSLSGARLRTVLPLTVVLGAALFSAFMLKTSGFGALSDDDYSRVTIAQTFAHSPALDPSKTSWLPFPFWILGTSLAVFGGTLEVARATAFALSLIGGGLLLRAAYNLGLGRWNGALVVLALVLLPTLRPFALATVPEYLCHASLVFATLGLATRKDLYLSGALLFTATLSRYEIWPAALVISALSLFEARATSSERSRLYFLSLAGVLGPLLWSLHGSLHHGSATFYVKRVIAYKAALGEDPRNALELFTTVPKALVTAEPGAFVMGLVAIALLSLEKRRGRPAPPLVPLLLPLVALLLGLTVGDVRGGAPTHHPERTLLAIWLALGLVAGLYAERHKKSRFLPALAATLLAGRALFGLEKVELNGTRTEEEAVGLLVREHLPKEEKVVLATTDYGYFAIMAAAGEPSRFRVLDTHDPRHRHIPMPIPPRVIAEAAKSGSCYAVLPLCVEMDGIVPIAETGAFTLARLTRPECLPPRGTAPLPP